MLVRLLLPLRVPPPAVVLANAIAGLAAVYLVVRGDLIGAALLLQVKTLLDNADGQLARRSGRTSAFGRYLDTEVDLLVNVALFAALGHVTGEWVLAGIAFVALTLVLSVDFNEDVMYRRAHGESVVTEPSTAGEARPACWLASVYRVFYGPQDRAIQAFAARRLERLLEGVSDPVDRSRRSPRVPRRASRPRSSRTSAFRRSSRCSGCAWCSRAPEAYLWFALACALVPVLLQVRRELVVRRSLG